MVNNFERTLTFLSPVKEGLGQSVLDRSCRNDDRGDLFFAELAALQAKKEAEEATRGASGRCSSLSIGEVGCRVGCNELEYGFRNIHQ